jgi:hypothetical protein
MVGLLLHKFIYESVVENKGEMRRIEVTLSYLNIVAPFIWVGFVAAISFMEAWLKFRAPGVTLVTGLSIGNVVFGALNRVEIILALLILAAIVMQPFRWTEQLPYILTVLLLIIQSVWLLPALSSRIAIYAEGGIPAPSNLHHVFVGLEAIKTAALLYYGIKQLSTWKILTPSH